MITEISEYDIVEIVTVNPKVPKAELGDIAVILVVHLSSGIAAAYEVECVFPDGTNNWEGTFLPSQIKLVEKVSG